MSMPSALTLLRNRNFLLVWLTSVTDNITLAVVLLSQTWYVVDSLHMKAQLGWMMIAQSVPRLGLMVFGGVLADRLPKIKIMRATFWLRMLAMACGALLFWSGTMTIWALIAVAATFGMLDAFFWPSRDALMPSIVTADELPRANTVMQATNQIGLIAGPIIGGVLLSLLPFHAIYAVTAAMMLLGAQLIGSVRLPDAPPQKHEHHMFAALQEGVRYVIDSPVLRTLMSIYVVANLLFTGAVSVGIPIIASERLLAGAQGLSYLQSAYACGMISGFVTLMLYPPKKKRLLLIVGLIVVEGILIALQGGSRSLPLSAVLQLLLGFCVACNNVPMLSLLQQYADRDKLGRVMSISSVTTMGLSPVSYALVSALLAGGAAVSMIMPVFGLTMSAVVALMALASKTVRSTN
ncbi:MAG: MFS transporter [Burkholderiaceae bacterium]|nr:MFS transporter [Burkholderiaceae bacterium]